MAGASDGTLSIGEVAERSGVAASALRYYESLGLVGSMRTSSGHRRYRRSVLRRLAFIVFAQRMGFSLREVGEALEGLGDGAIPTRADWARLTGAWVTRVEERIAELERLRDGLTECIGCGCLSLDRCRLANPDDEAASLGPGPRYWMGDRPRAKAGRRPAS